LKKSNKRNRPVCDAIQPSSSSGVLGGLSQRDSLSSLCEEYLLEEEGRKLSVHRILKRRKSAGEFGGLSCNLI
jgi:hypothetical protein